MEQQIVVIALYVHSHAVAIMNNSFQTKQNDNGIKQKTDDLWNFVDFRFELRWNAHLRSGSTSI